MAERVSPAWLSTAPPPAAENSELLASSQKQRKIDTLRGGTGLARAILITVLCAFLLVEAINVATSPIPLHGLDLVVGYVSIALAFVIQVANSSVGATQWPASRRAAALLAQGVITYFPLVVLGKEWGGMAGFLAGSVLLLVPGWTAWALFSGIVLSMLVVPLMLSISAPDIAYLMISTVDTGLVIFGLSRLSMIVSYLRTAQDAFTHMAILDERMRFSRDLHDLLGYDLSAITLKVELARRVAESNPGRATDEIAEVLDISRQALADVRMVAKGYRNMSLEKEATAVTSLLSAAGIAVETNINCGALDETVDTVLAIVLREAATNVLRHSMARNCSIQACRHGETIRLRVINDGVSDGVSRAQAQDRSSGGGLPNMSFRLLSVGGHMTASVQADGCFELIAESPAQSPARNGEVLP